MFEIRWVHEFKSGFYLISLIKYDGRLSMIQSEFIPFDIINRICIQFNRKSL